MVRYVWLLKSIKKKNILNEKSFFCLVGPIKITEKMNIIKIK